MDVILKMKTKDAKVVTRQARVTQKPIAGEYINVVSESEKDRVEKEFAITKIVHDPIIMMLWVYDVMGRRTS